MGIITFIYVFCKEDTDGFFLGLNYTELEITTYKIMQNSSLKLQK